MITKAQDTIFEYHNRLVEFFRLKERGVDPDLLQEHADGVRLVCAEYRAKALRGGRAQSNPKFVRDSFPDLPALEYRFFTEEGHT